jgi:hypothetical protein
MSHNINKFAKAHNHARCIDAKTRELLPDYMVELLADPIADEVEEHLIFCRRCREDYLKFLSLRSSARQAKAAGVAAQSYGAIDVRTLLGIDLED